MAFASTSIYSCEVIAQSHFHAKRFGLQITPGVREI